MTQDKKISRRDLFRLSGGALFGLGFAPTMLPVAQPRTNQRTPILMYHRVEVPPASADESRLNLTVHPDIFQGQMDYLVSAGYTSLTFADWTRAMAGEQEMPEKPVVITFDDGYIDSYTVAYPRLQERGLVGTFFIVPTFLHQWGYMDWGHLTEMHNAGHEIANHSMTHADLSRLTREELETEIIGAADVMEQTLGFRPETFCYPFGRYNQLTLGVVRDSGHQAAVTTRFGLRHNYFERFGLERVRIPGDMSVAGFGWWIEQQA